MSSGNKPGGKGRRVLDLCKGRLGVGAVGEWCVYVEEGCRVLNVMKRVGGR